MELCFIVFFDLKMISKSLANGVKNVLSNLIDSIQIAYVNERFIGESGRLIVDVIKVCDIKKNKWLSPNSRFQKSF